MDNFEFEKRITIHTQTDKGIFLYNLDAMVDSQHLVKTAAEYHPDIAQYIRTAQKIPGKLQVLVTALGASEYYGPNTNGDDFPEAALKHEGADYGYKTFEYNAKVFKHHKNKSDSPSYGIVRLSVWNDKMKRVELILILDREKEPELCRRIDSGEFPPLSMGCLKADTLVRMWDMSVKRVDNIVAGDYVMDASGKPVSVDYPHSHHHKGYWYTVAACGCPEELPPTTEEHPWMVIPKEHLECFGNPKNKSRRTKKCIPGFPKRTTCTDCPNEDAHEWHHVWKRADELSVGDYIAFPIPNPKPCPPRFEFLPELSGWYISDGSITSDGYLRFDWNTDKQVLVEKLNKLFPDKVQVAPRAHSDSAQCVMVYDKQIASVLEATFGKNSLEKYLPVEVFGWDEKETLQLLGAWVSCDGGFYKDCAYFSTANKNLALQLRLLLASVGIVSSINKIHHKPSTVVDKNTIEYQVWVGNGHAYKLTPYATKQGPITPPEHFVRHNFIFANKLWCKITHIDESVCDEPVYNIAIDHEDFDRQSYTVESVALHNCRVPYDICSCCGNRAKTRKEYCEHLKFYMNKIPPGYTKVARAINTLPKFFDISFVIIGADSIAKVMLKVASHGSVAERDLSYEHADSNNDPRMRVQPAPMSEINRLRDDLIRRRPDLAGRFQSEKTASGLSGLAKLALLGKKATIGKRAEIDKEVPSNLNGNIAKIIDASAAELRSSEPDMSRRTIIIMCMPTGNNGVESHGMPNLNRVLSTLTSLGILPKQHEFQDIVLNALGHRRLADDLAMRREVFHPAADMQLEGSSRRNLMDFIESQLDINPEHIDESLLNHVMPIIPERSYAAPILHRRLMVLANRPHLARIKTASVEKYAYTVGPAGMMAFLAGVYTAVAKRDPSMTTNIFEKAVMKHPLIAAALGVGAIASIQTLATPRVVGHYDVDPRTGTSAKPLSIDEYVARANDIPYASNMRFAANSGNTKVAGIAGKVFLGVPGIYLASGMQEAKRARDPYAPEGTVGQIVREHPDVLSAALVGEHVIGRPISSKIGDLATKGLSALKATKVASFSGILDADILNVASSLLRS